MRGSVFFAYRLLTTDEETIASLTPVRVAATRSRKPAAA